ncbi:MAG: signal recognition particle-docking protein FtsY [Pseudomonadota bacterium]
MARCPHNGAPLPHSDPVMKLFSFLRSRKRDTEPSEQTGAPLEKKLEKTGSRLRLGLLDRLLGRSALDEDLIEELETELLMADVGVETAGALMTDLRERAKQGDANKSLRDHLADGLVARLDPVEQPLEIEQANPYVILVVGVNGSGKTTTIGKLAQQLQRGGLSVMLAAGDTFRAAAVEQLQAWGERNQVPVIAQGAGADAASVIFDAVSAARARNVDVLIADTAGRLQTQSNLMDELSKVLRVIRKLDESAPHEVLLVLDGSTGQNALSQATQFHAAAGVSGVVVTKLDGTAKGGIVFALAHQLKLPVRFIGVGEGIDDLRPFQAREFVDALLGDSAG